MLDPMEAIPSPTCLGVERLTVDYRAECPPGGIRRTLERLSLPDGSEAVFLDGADWSRLWESHGRGASVHPGGNVGNALEVLAGAEPGLRALWSGPSSPDPASRRCLWAFRESRIEASPTWREDGTTRTLLLVEADAEGVRSGRHTIFISLGAWPSALTMPRGGPHPALVGLDTVLTAPDELWERIESAASEIVLCVNHAVRAGASLARVRSLFDRRRISLVSGRDDELAPLASGLGESLTTLATRQEALVIATRGREGLTVWSPEGQDPIVRPGATVTEREIVDTVGAGDAVLGGFLAARLSGRGLEACVLAAERAAREALGHASGRGGSRRRTAWASPTPLGTVVDESAAIRAEIEWGAGLAVVCGGQTGVDQAALRCGTHSGLGTHAVLPQGRLTEKGALDGDAERRLGSPRVHVLSSASYRDRTWATAYIADATLLVRLRTSSGGDEAALACRQLGRPLVVTDADPRDLERVVGELERTGAQVLNIAGHRGSGLRDGEAARIEGFLSRLVPRLCRRQPGEADRILPVGGVAAGLGESRLSAEAEGRPVQVAVPSTGPMRAWLERSFGRSLFSEAAVRIVPGRPRDFGAWLAEEAVDLALCGLDDIAEGGSAWRVAADFGTFTSALVLVGNRPAPERIVAQSPRLARRLLSEVGLPADLREIAGGAEAWITLGLAEGAVDTWSTGKTARAAALAPIARLGSTSLVAATVGVPTAPVEWLLREMGREQDEGPWDLGTGDPPLGAADPA